MKNNQRNSLQKHLFKLLLFTCSSLIPKSLSAGVAYPDPPGGWTYIYDVTNAIIVGAPNSGFTSLDGTWSHDNGGDSWDGSVIGGLLTTNATFGLGNAPGGAMGVTEDGVSYLRMQDPGNPGSAGFGFPSAVSNRKVLFMHNMTLDTPEGITNSLLDDGVTLSFRARIPTPSNTTNALDQLYPDLQGAFGPQPYPAAGDGMQIAGGGGASFSISQPQGGTPYRQGGTIGFCLTLPNDDSGDPLLSAKANFAGLTMNRLAITDPYDITDLVGFYNQGAFNGVPLDPTQWHEFWIVIRTDPGGIGSHQVFVFRDGSTNPTVFSVTSGDLSRIDDANHLMIGSPLTTASAAVDMDFLAYKTNAVFPPGFSLTNAYPGGFDYSPSGFRQDLYDGTGSGTTLVDTNSIAVTLNGLSITPQLSKPVVPADLTTITYNGVLPSGTNVVNVTFADTGSPPATQTVAHVFSFTYPTLPPSFIVPRENVDTNAPGFNIRVVQAGFNMAKSVAVRETQLNGTLIDPGTGTNAVNIAGTNSSPVDPNDPYIYAETNTLNYLDFMFDTRGFFAEADGFDRLPPGIPGSTGNSDNFVHEIITYLDLPAGLHRVGLATDDGHRLSAGRNPKDVANLLEIGITDLFPAFGWNERVYYFLVQEAGIYPFRLLWYDANDEAVLEWYSFSPANSSGGRILINDLSNPNAVKAYRLARPQMDAPTLSGGNVTISWRGTGTLEQADAVSGPWTTALNQGNPQTVPAVGSKFYRVRQ